jgi:hypothetical protein
MLLSDIKRGWCCWKVNQIRLISNNLRFLKRFREVEVKLHLVDSKNNLCK